MTIKTGAWIKYKVEIDFSATPDMTEVRYYEDDILIQTAVDSDIDAIIGTVNFTPYIAGRQWGAGNSIIMHIATYWSYRIK